MSGRLLYDGHWFHWYTPGDGGKADKFHATSGLPEYTDRGGKLVPSHQKPKDQCVPDAGPIPAGKYFFVLAIDPALYARDDGTNRCNLASGKMIQQIPRGKDAGKCEPYWSNWGRNRVRLEAADTATRKVCKTPRDGFYLHDSTKGYTHGCIEVEPRFFDRLTKYARRARGRRISVEVKYAFADTYGDTLK